MRRILTSLPDVRFAQVIGLYKVTLVTSGSGRIKNIKQKNLVNSSKFNERKKPAAIF